MENDMANFTRGEFKPDDPIFREGWSAHSAPPQASLRPLPADAVTEQYTLQRRIERAVAGVK